MDIFFGVFLVVCGSFFFVALFLGPSKYKDSPVPDKLFTPVKDKDDVKAAFDNIANELNFKDSAPVSPVPSDPVLPLSTITAYGHGPYAFGPTTSELAQIAKNHLLECMKASNKVSTKKSRKTAGNSKLGSKLKKKPKKRKPKK